MSGALPKISEGADRHFTRGRAQTQDEKHAFLARLEAAWLKTPDLRFGQLVDNAKRYWRDGAADLFYIEDTDLLFSMEMISRMAQESK